MGNPKSIIRNDGKVKTENLKTTVEAQNINICWVKISFF
jgi:hypothetical protein